MRRHVMLWMAGIAGLWLAAASAGALEIPLTVVEPAGVARTAEPVSAGIPLPWGRFHKDTLFCLLDGGREVPVQVLPLVVDDQGMLRWVLVDFQTDLGPRESKTFTLRVAAPTAVPAQAIKVTDAADAVTVDTGKVSFTIAKDKPFALFDAAQAAGQALVAGGGASYTDGFSGKTYVAGKPASVEVEYAGPLRTTLCVKGGFVGDEDTKLGYIARLTAWAGRGDVLVKYSLANSNPDHYTFRQIKDSTVRVKLAGAAGGVTVGAARPLAASGDVWMQQSERVVPAAVHSHDVMGNCPFLRETPGASGPGGAKAVAGEQELWVSQGKGDQSEGWLAAGANGGRVWVCDLYFVEDPPRRLAAADGVLALTGVTEPLEGTKAPFAERTRWLFDCSHLSSQYVFDFAAPADAAALSGRSKQVRARVWAMAPPAWYFQTEGLAVGKFGTQADEMACYDAWGWKYDKADAPQHAEGQAGRIQRYVAADDNHFTSEQDTLDALLLMYVRTGSRSFFDGAEAWANYFADLQTWRTDGWRWKDGGGWWHGGPAGNRPQRAADPVTGVRNSLPAEWTPSFNIKVRTLDRAGCVDLNYTFLAKACHCHNWGEGLAEWFCLTGDRDFLEAAIDTVEQNIDTQRRAFGKAPGKPASFSRDFTRSCYLTNATRLVVPADPFVADASDYLAAVYLQRPNPEPRGFVNSAKPEAVDLKGYVGDQGIAEMKRLGVTMDAKSGQLTDAEGHKWFTLVQPHTWMYPPLSRAMGLYYRLTGSEDAQDWTIAYGEAVSHVMYQPRHGNLTYGKMLADFPLRGVVKDWASWVLPPDAKDGEGVVISGYLGEFYPDVAARAYGLCGDPFLKKRAYDYWFYSSHRPYNSTKMYNVGGVGRWANAYSTHDETVCYTGRMFYEWSHPRTDTAAPAAVSDLQVTVAGDKATVRFTAPADAGGRAARYQVKCSDKPIVAYVKFLDAFAAFTDDKVANWWMAANVTGEPAPAAAGMPESFTVTNVPANARYFAVVSFDEATNRSALSNVAEGK